MTEFLRAPLINVNDESMLLVEWLKDSGDYVRVGEIIAVIETTKSTADFESEFEGYFTSIVKPGGQIHVGQVIAAITDEPDGVFEIPTTESEKTVEISAERAWTKKAEILAQRYGLDIATLGVIQMAGEVIGEADLLAYFESGILEQAPSEGQDDLLDSPYPDNRQERVLVIGAGGAGVQILDVITRVPGQRAVGILDDNPALLGKRVMGVPVLGAVSDGPGLFKEGVFDAGIISIGTDVNLRARIFDNFVLEGVPFTNVIDPSAQILSNVSLGVGNAVMPLVQIAAATRVGNNNFLSTFVDLEHHNVLGDHCTFGPGVMTSGNVRIGSRVKFGAGVFIEPGLSIGSDCLVASGVILTRSIPENSIVKTKTNFTIRKRDV